MRWWKILLSVVGVLVIAGASFVWFFKHPTLVSAVDENNLPKFIQADFIDLDKVASISKFRSASGHDFSAHGETCRSMKHYFQPPFNPNAKMRTVDGQQLPPLPDGQTDTPIYSPVDGKIISLSDEHTPIGKQFSIRPDSNPNFNVRIFHVFPSDGIHALMNVKAGQQLGVIGKDQGTDIAIETTTLKGTQFVSYFQVMPDAIFANYQKHGITSRDDLIFTKSYRDAHPLQCTNNKDEQFAQNYQGDINYDGEVYLSGYARPNVYQQGNNQGSQNSQPGNNQNNVPTNDNGTRPGDNVGNQLPSNGTQDSPIQKATP